jgi:hypothetical protein
MSSETTQVIRSVPRSSPGKFLWVAVWSSLLMIISGVGHTVQIYYIDATNGDDNYTGISEAAPWQTLASINERTYQPGDKVLLKRGEVWTGNLEVGEDSDGDASHPITFGAYGIGKDPSIRRVTLRGDYVVFENLVIDHNKETGDALRLRGAKNCILRHLIVRNGLADGIDAADADGLLVDSCLVHHFLAGSFTQQADAHGIVATDTQGLIIRNTEVHHVSGDSFQADPNRNDPCDDILIEDCYFWTSPLSEDFNERWFAGQTPGENAIDTKVSKTRWESARRMRINIRNIRAHGWINDGFISIRAAFNMKEKIEAIFDGVTVYDCHVAFRLRGSLGNANVTLTNAVIYNCEKAIRAENGLSNLRIYNSTFGDGIDTQFQIVAGDNSRTWDIRNNVFVDSKHAVASANNNKIVNAHDFVDNSRRNYYLKHESGFMDAVKPEGDDTVNGVTTILRAKPDNPRARPATGFRITYRWQTVPMDRDYSVFVHFINKDGETILQDDHKPPTPTSSWEGLVEYTRTVPLPVWQPKDKRTIDVTLPEGEYSIYAGLYDKKEGRKSLNAGHGVTRVDEGTYEIGSLSIDTKAPIPEPGEKTLDLTGYHVTFDEEFDDLSVSAWGPCGTGGSRWIAHTPWKGDFGDARFTDPGPDFPFTVRDGILRIEARKENGQWRSGLLSAVDPDGNGFKQKYGYFECRAKFPKGPGTWPAFWLMGTLNLKGNTGPRINPEVDVFEYYGHWPNRFSYVLHLWGFDGAESRHYDTERIVVFGLDEDFHTYGMMIDEEHMILYFDGVEMHRRKTPEAVKIPLFPLVNLALGPGWPTDKTPNPSYMYVDYVKVYSK